MSGWGGSVTPALTSGARERQLAALEDALVMAAADLDAAASRVEGLPNRVRKQLPAQLQPAFLRARARETREAA